MATSIQELLNTVGAHNPEADLKSVRKAYVFAASVHDGHTQLNREPYILFLLAVAGVLARLRPVASSRLRLDEAAIAAALLYDTVEFASVPPEDIREFFGEEVAGIVDGVSRLRGMFRTKREEQQGELIRKTFQAEDEDARALAILLADRLHTMRTLHFRNPHKGMRIAREVLGVYVPLADGLGLSGIARELEELGNARRNDLQ